MILGPLLIWPWVLGFGLDLSMSLALNCVPWFQDKQWLTLDSGIDSSVSVGCVLCGQWSMFCRLLKGRTLLHVIHGLLGDHSTWGRVSLCGVLKSMPKKMVAHEGYEMLLVLLLPMPLSHTHTHTIDCDPQVFKGMYPLPRSSWKAAPDASPHAF